MNLTKTSKVGFAIIGLAILIAAIGNIWAVSLIDHSVNLPLGNDMKTASEFIEQKMVQYDSSFTVMSSSTIVGRSAFIVGLTVFVLGFFSRGQQRKSIPATPSAGREQASDGNP